MVKSRDLCLATLATLALLHAEVSGVHLRGRIVHVGLPASGQDLSSQGLDHYRVGFWTPIRVELTNDDGDLFNGWIEARQADRDGDDVVARQDVSVRDTRRYDLYVPGGIYQSLNQFNVRVFDENGGLAVLHDDGDKRVLELAPPRQVYPVPNETRIILDISARPMNQLSALPLTQNLLRDLLIARSSPEELPDNVAGLAMADVIVWDDADPSKLRDPAQLRAVIEWTQRGGTLVLGVGRNWLIVAKSGLGDLLPARLTGVAAANSPDFLPGALVDLLFGEPGAHADLNPPLNYCPVTRETLASDADAIVPADPQPQDRIFVSRRPCGRGEVVLVAAELRELLTHATQTEPFLRQVLSVRRKQPEPDDSHSSPGPDLFRHVEIVTAFQAIAGLYFLFAFAFTIAYIVAATAGSWVWLKRKGLIRHAWTVFAAVAVLASTLSLVSVRLVRGIGHRVQEFSIIDGRAGSFETAATCYFGLKTGSHTHLDLRVPANWLDPENSPEALASLRPLAPDANTWEQSVYAAGQRYEAVPVLGELRSVPFRATLKQFEADWRGSLNGRLQASLRRAPDTASRLHPDSWIENDLGTALDNCYLFVARRGFIESRPRRFNEIDVYPLGDLAAGQRLRVMSVFDEKDTLDDRPNRAGTRNAARSSEPLKKRLLLTDAQAQWLRKFVLPRYGTVEDEDRVIKVDAETFASALLLLSTFDEIDLSEFANRGQTVERSQGQRLDRTSCLTEDEALFVGFSRDPGPARLCWRKPGSTTDRWRPVQPSQARVMYRITVPVSSP